MSKKWSASQQRWALPFNIELLDDKLNTKPHNGTSIGFDISLTSTGVVVLNTSKEIEESFLIETSATDGRMSERLWNIYNEVYNICLKYKPDIVAFEDINVGRNIRSAISLGMAKGVILTAIEDVSDWEPYFLMANVSTIKLAALGSGKADKNKVMAHVYKKWDYMPESDDQADAYVVARLGTYLWPFKNVLKTSLNESTDTDQFLLDLYKERRDDVYDNLSLVMDEDCSRALMNHFKAGRTGGTGLLQMKENDRSFYETTRKKLADK